MCLGQGHNTVIGPGIEIKIFRLRVGYVNTGPLLMNYYLWQLKHITLCPLSPLIDSLQIDHHRPPFHLPQ